MDFPYIKVTRFYKHLKSERILPWIRFGIFNPKDESKIIYPLGLVDSGSELTFITHEFGEQLGYDIKAGKKDQVGGVGGGAINVYYHKVGIILKDGTKRESYKFTDIIGFTYSNFPMSMPQQTAILGTIDFFRHVNVCFKYPVAISINQNS